MSARSTAITSSTCCRCCRTCATRKNGPIIVHVRTQKGKGYAPAENSADKYHGVVAFDVITGAQAKPKANAPAYTKVFGESLVKEAEKDDRIVAITAAMPSGTGVDVFAKRFPARTFDVGIAEQHARHLRRRLATEGYKPFCAIYSTFLQRAYDQVVHDVAIQNLPVRFAIDRAGPRRRRRSDACRQLRPRLSRLPAELRDHGGGRRGGPRAHGGDRRGARFRPDRLPLSARRGRRRGHAGGRRAA